MKCHGHGAPVPSSTRPREAPVPSRAGRLGGVDPAAAEGRAPAPRQHRRRARRRHEHRPDRDHRARHPRRFHDRRARPRADLHRRRPRRRVLPPGDAEPARRGHRHVHARSPAWPSVRSELHRRRRTAPRPGRRSMLLGRRAQRLGRSRPGRRPARGVSRAKPSSSASCCSAGTRPRTPGVSVDPGPSRSTRMPVPRRSWASGARTRAGRPSSCRRG